ncbi:hypothetical protein IWW55_003932 [Coemansia sp. RSA 2706]|nr:hypothetical protein IWW55_003932 [Coemansia sp. RSA 2706]
MSLVTRLSQHPLLGMLWEIAQTASWRHYALAVVGALAAFYMYRLVYGLFYSPLRGVPGSLLSRVTHKRTELLTIAGQMAHLGRWDHEKYGDIFMTTPSSVAICDPADIRAFMGNSAVCKADYYRILEFTEIETTVTFRENEHASVRHRQVGPYFRPTHLAKMEKTIMGLGIETIKGKWDALLDESADGTAEVNYCNDFLISAFGIISTLVYGKRVKELSKSDAATAQWIDMTMMYLSVRAMFLLLPRALVLLLLRPWEHYYYTLSNYIDEAITSRTALVAKLADAGRLDEKPVDMLQALLDAEDPETKARMTREQVHGECMLMMHAGSDTTSHTIAWTVHLLTLYPEHLRRATAEVRAAFAPDHVITYKECRAHLPFIEACIFESLRLVPVTGGLLPRVVPPGGLVIKGHYLPQGTVVFVNTAVANHHPTFWDNPHEFDPTRFLANRDLQHYILTFSHGKRMCPGKNLAWWEMLTIMANILKDYDFKIPDDLTHLGPHVLNKHGFPQIMKSKQYIAVKPVDAERDCRLIISRAQN